jgi:hypothetical protein
MIGPLPASAYWCAIGLLVAAVGAQQVRVASVERALAQEQSARADDSLQQALVNLDWVSKVSDLQTKHAADQQQLEETHVQKMHKLETAGAVDRADAQRMRGKLANFASSASQPGETDAAACQRARDRLPKLGDLLAEGIELEAESRSIIERRDAEVGRLLDQIHIDRAAMPQTGKGSDAN